MSARETTPSVPGPGAWAAAAGGGPRPAPPTLRVVVLAAGRGRRLRGGTGSAALTPAQREAAAAGLKGLVPLAGRPLLDRALEGLAAAGLREVCLVVGREGGPLRARYATARPGEPAVTFALQQRPRGTADALLAAEAFTAGEPFLVVNADNLYPTPGLAALASLPGNGVLALDRAALLASGRSQVEEDRLASYALLETDGAGRLARLREKPGRDVLRRAPEPVLLGVNAWRFTAPIFAACRAVAPSERGELELPAAVQHARDVLGESFDVVVSGGPFHDLTEAADVLALDRLLARAEGLP